MMKINSDSFTHSVTVGLPRFSDVLVVLTKFRTSVSLEQYDWCKLLSASMFKNYNLFCVLLRVGVQEWMK